MTSGVRTGMAKVTLEQLAKSIGKPVEQLIGQMEKAGLPDKSASDVISEEEKMQLIQSLKKKDRVTLRRKSVSQIKVKSRTSGPSTVNVEVRKRKVYVDKKALPEEQAEAPEPEKKPQPKPGKKPDKPEVKSEVKPGVKPGVKAGGKDEGKDGAKAGVRPDEKAAKPDKKVAPAAATPKRRQEKAAPAAKVAAGGEKKEGRRELKVAKEKRGKRKAKKKRVRLEKVIQPRKQEFERPTAPVKRDIEVPETISVGELSQRLAIKSGELIKEMIGMGMMATINQTLDQDTAILIVEDLGHSAKPVSEANLEKFLLADEPVADAEALPRAPVVTVMGHVDHGKTSLLDRIRKSQVADAEAGGITQHIGAYHVSAAKGDVTFLDTPGHAAFTSMRARGANATDIVVLVVAADDGVMPQTEEAIEHSRAAGVPIVVAVNKIDKEDADVDKIKGDLSKKGITPEAWGGENIFVEISAKTGEGIDALLEAVLLQVEVMELKAPIAGPARGIVIESALDKGRGPVATVLVQQGTLNKGDVLLAGREFGRVRVLLDENGKALASAKPSIPAVMLGLSGAPEAGEEVRVVSSERKAREIAEFRSRKVREGKLASQKPQMIAENIFEHLEKEPPSVLNLLVKADVQGSTEALRDSLTALSAGEVSNKIISSGIGGINESDVDLAAASGAVVIGFNVRADAQARKTAQAEDVQIRYYSVIYEAIDDVRKIMSGMLRPEVKERIVGVAEVKDVFRSSKMGAVAGCQVVEGSVKRGNPIRVLRDNVVIFEGGLESLRRHKDDVGEVNSGVECGIAVKNYNDVRPGDSIEVYEQVEVRREL